MGACVGPVLVRLGQARRVRWGSPRRASALPHLAGVGPQGRPQTFCGSQSRRGGKGGKNLRKYLGRARARARWQFFYDVTEVYGQRKRLEIGRTWCDYLVAHCATY